MENERIERETHYQYDENEKLVSMTIHETITNPNCDCNGCDEGELVADEIELVEDASAFTEAALALIGLGLCFNAVASIFKRR